MASIHRVIRYKIIEIMEIPVADGEQDTYSFEQLTHDDQKFPGTFIPDIVPDGWVPEPEPQPESYYRVITTKLNIRNGAGTQYDDTGDKFKNEVVPCYQEKRVYNPIARVNDLWIQIDPQENQFVAAEFGGNVYAVKEK